MQTNMLIDGQLQAGNGELLPVYNPATGEVRVWIAEASPELVAAAVSAADRALPAWARTTPKDRAAILLQIAD